MSTLRSIEERGTTLIIRKFGFKRSGTLVLGIASLLGSACLASAFLVLDVGLMNIVEIGSIAIGMMILIHAGVARIHRAVFDSDMHIQVSHDCVILNDRRANNSSLRHIVVVSSPTRYSNIRFKIGFADTYGRARYIVWFVDNDEALVILRFLESNTELITRRFECILAYRPQDIRFGLGTWRPIPTKARA